ncbi:MAG: ferredoxin [bacterium]|jgi:ferredoxin
MKATVDADLCSGCELCTQTCPEVYEMEGDVAVVKVDPIPPELEDSAQEAADDCPVEAIKID